MDQIILGLKSIINHLSLNDGEYTKRQMINLVCDTEGGDITEEVHALAHDTVVRCFLNGASGTVRNTKPIREGLQEDIALLERSKGASQPVPA